MGETLMACYLTALVAVVALGQLVVLVFSRPSDK